MMINLNLFTVLFGCCNAINKLNRTQYTLSYKVMKQKTIFDKVCLFVL